MSSNLEIPPDKRFREARPFSIVITRILILISFVPITAGLVIAVLSLVISNPTGLFSIRSLAFISLGFSLIAVFLFYGYRGLGNGDRHGYWIGLLFLVLTGAAGIYKLTLTLKSFGLIGPNQTQHLYLSKELVLLDVTVQVAIVAFLLGLLLKFAFGKQERGFFSSSP